MAGAGSEWIFVSYRRTDAAGHAFAVYQRLLADFGLDAVFFDDQRIDAGANFPARLKSAVDAALVVVAVMGPEWLPELKKRAKRVGEVDYVRLELAQALTARPDNSQRLVVPVLMADAKAVSAKALGVGFQPDLGELANKHAVELRGANWDAGYKLLAKQIEPIRLARAGGTADHAAMSVGIAKTLRSQLSRSDLQPLAGCWVLKEANGVFAVPAADLLDDLGLAVRTLALAWQNDPSKAPASAIRERLPQHCRNLAVELLTLGVDPAAACLWVQSGESAPCQTVGMSVLIRAVGVGEALAVDPVASGLDFRPERVYAMDAALDNGAAQKHRFQVARGLWPDAFAMPLVGDVTDEVCAGLAIRINRLTKRDRRSFVVTAAIKDPSHRSELTLLARPFNAIGLGREVSGLRPVLREPEAELVDAFCLCLQEIEQLP